MHDSAPLFRVDDGDVAIVRITRPRSLNALNKELLESLAGELRSISQAKYLRAMIVTGDGESAFCAGADLKERREMSLEQTQEFVHLIGTVFRQVELIEIPTIAVMNGVAFGGGLELALACDFRIAVKVARMGLTECALGIIPGAGGTQRLPRLIGLSAAKEMILTAKVIDAAEALRLGAVDKIADNVETAMAEARSLIDGIRRCAPLSVKAAKRAIQAGLDVELGKGLEIEFNAYQTIINSQDRVEGLRAFAEKRPPNFVGR